MPIWAPEMLWIFDEVADHDARVELFADAITSLARQWIVRSMIQKLLVSRFQLTFHHDKKELGVFGGIGATRIDHDHPRAALLLARQHPLEGDGMAPGGVGADEHHEIRLVDILVAAGYGVGAEGAAMAGDGRCHA